MADLVTSFRDFVERERLFDKADKLLLACSGGLDSTVLAHLLHAEGYDFAVAHMNFQLRGEASDGDAAFVEDLARTLDAKFYCKAVDVEARALPGESTQMTARRLRYDWFESLVDYSSEGSMIHVVLAHHLEDNFETVLMNLIRGTGIRGVFGIEPIRFFTPAIPFFAVRPLLNTSRQDIRAYATKHSIAWREDASNESDDYLRNRIRHHLAPVFYDDFGMSSETWAKTADNLRKSQEFYLLGIKSVVDKCSEWKQGVLVIDRHQLSEIKDQFTVLQACGFGNRFTDDQFKQMISLSGNRRIEGDRAWAYVTPDTWSFDFMSDDDFVPSPQLEVLNLPFSEEIQSKKISISLIPCPATFGEAGVQYLAPTNLPLHLRPRQKGDRFKPLGMGGKSKKVKDYMIDEKIPVWLRDRIYLLTNAEGEIMAIPGYCISERFKVLPHHTEVLKVTAG